MKKSSFIIQAIALITAMVSYLFWEYIPIDYIFYYGIALAFVGYTFVIYNQFQNLLTFTCVAGSLINLMDELIGNPTAIMVTEFIIFALYLGIGYYKFVYLKKNGKKEATNNKATNILAD